MSSFDGNKIIWEVVDDSVVEEGKEHNEIKLQWGWFYLFGKY